MEASLSLLLFGEYLEKDLNQIKEVSSYTRIRSVEVEPLLDYARFKELIKPK